MNILKLFVPTWLVASPALKAQEFPQFSGAVDRARHYSVVAKVLTASVEAAIKKDE
ncbi:MAG: hypothetical protein LBR06_00300 [Bacteroidales bacterium]|jgi:hypothetical protein|nr:hypothetical protein [Bacteroidales bacterium]